jgi:hypothetical protein
MLAALVNPGLGSRGQGFKDRRRLKMLVTLA